MKISHEVPFILLEKSKSFNDYDYALVHLFEEHDNYYNFYKQSIKEGRTVLLDNSIFELGTAFDSEKFANYINELKPTEYVIPDVWWDGEKTIKELIKWLNKYNSLPGKKIGVVQGKTFQEITKCYKQLSQIEEIDKIAISFTYPFYEQLFKLDNKLKSQMLGRIWFIKYLKFNFEIKKPLHLFGCSLPQEFGYYKGDNFIESIDTSNPVIHGASGIGYQNLEGLNFKSEKKIIEILKKELNKEQLKVIKYNIETFKKIAGVKI